jgi:hypothetical protein
MRTTAIDQKRKNFIFKRLQTQSYINKIIKLRAKSSENKVNTNELVQNKDKIIDFIKRIEDRKSRTYHNESGIKGKEEIKG